MRWAVIQFPASNCDQDALHVLKEVLGQDADYVWHKETSLNGADAVVVPGGFSYGDYLRCGAIARFSPIMRSGEVKLAASRQTVLGICNGFQILCEAGLLPGVLACATNKTPFSLRDDFGSRRESRHSLHERISDRPGSAPADRARRRSLRRRRRNARFAFPE